MNIFIRDEFLPNNTKLIQLIALVISGVDFPLEAAEVRGGRKGEWFLGWSNFHGFVISKSGKNCINVIFWYIK